MYKNKRDRFKERLKQLSTPVFLLFSTLPLVVSQSIYANTAPVWNEDGGVDGRGYGRIDYGSNSTKVVVVDFDNDGISDIVSGTTNKNVFWYKGVGDGTFGDPILITDQMKSIKGFQLVDFDGDLDLDIVTSSSDLESTQIGWFENNGNQTFSDFQVIANGGNTQYFKAAVDFDGDGYLDILSSSGNDNNVAWVKNFGDGTYSDLIVISEDLYNTTSAIAADLDGDGKPDIITSSFSDNTVAWFKNLGDGSFGPKQILADDVLGAFSVYVSDFDDDNKPDVFSASRLDNTIAWYKNLGEGSFSSKRVLSSSVPFASQVLISDLDLDGDQDVLGLSSSDGIFFVENIDFVFQPEINIRRHIGNSNGVKTMTVADMDYDGDEDLLVSASRLLGYKKNDTFSEPDGHIDHAENTTQVLLPKFNVIDPDTNSDQLEYRIEEDDERDDFLKYFDFTPPTTLAFKEAPNYEDYYAGSNDYFIVRLVVSDGESSDSIRLFIRLTDDTTEDDDQDGLTDAEEHELGTSVRTNDTDNDSVLDGVDVFPLDGSEWLDTDGDTIGNNADLDDDQDGYPDTEDDLPLNPSEWLDTDGDTIGNNEDTDDDNDGVSDSDELNVYFTDPLSQDSDQDGLNDLVEIDLGTNPNNSDSDNDQLPDQFEVSLGLNPKFNDGDLDSDSDGLSNLGEYQAGTDLFIPDTDDDGMPDGYEVNNGLDPIVSDSDQNPDGDAKTNLEEYQLGTDPQVWEVFTVGLDVDGNGVVNGFDFIMIHRYLSGSEDLSQNIVLPKDVFGSGVNGSFTNEEIAAHVKQKLDGFSLDVDGNGGEDGYDLLMIRRYLGGIYNISENLTLPINTGGSGPQGARTTQEIRTAIEGILENQNER